MRLKTSDLPKDLPPSQREIFEEGFTDGKIRGRKYNRYAEQVAFLQENRKLVDIHSPEWEFRTHRLKWNRLASEAYELGFAKGLEQRSKLKGGIG